MTTSTQPRVQSDKDFKRSGFWALIVTQFQGAFNDNLYQYLIIFFLLGAVADSMTPEAIAALPYIQRQFHSEDFVYSFATFLFSLPFILFPAFCGALADRYSKQRIALAAKYIEVVVMIFGGIAFLMGNSIFIWSILFCMAVHSTVFSPAKYGIIPEIMPESRLSWANGILQMGTIVAIITGTAFAGPLSDALKGRTYLASILLVTLSILGVITAHFITKPPAANPRQRIPMNPLLPWAGMGPYFRAIWQHKLLFNVVLGYVYFWFGGALVRQSVLKFAHTSMGMSDTLATGWVAAMGVGIGVGAVAAGYLSREKIETGIIPIGAAGMGVFSLLLALLGLFMYGTGTGQEQVAAGGIGLPADHMSLPFFIVFGLLFWLGFFAGFFDVPLAAAIQARAPDQIKGGVIATTNMLTFVGIAGASLLFFVLSKIGLSPSGIFLVSGLMSVGLGVYISLRIPSMILRSVLWILANSVYRVRVLGRDKVPEHGGALWVANHLTFADTLALAASTDREIHFVMGREVQTAGGLCRLSRFMHVIPVDPAAGKAGLDAVVAEIRARIAAGEVVCVPCERRFHENGEIMPYHNDYGMLTRGLNAPVVPVHLSHLWGCLYNVENGRFVRLPAPSRPYNIMVSYGDHFAEEAPGASVRQAVQQLGSESYGQRPLTHELLHRGFIKVARKNKRTLAITDAVTGDITYLKALIGSIAFARKLRRTLDNQKMVGVLVPPSVGGVLTNIALQIMGRVPVNLNYTAARESMASAAEQCGITQVLTSRKFLERLPMEVPGQAIYLEDIRTTVTGFDQFIALLYALFAPIWLIERIAGSPKKRSSGDLATIIFSSGSEGEPKGVMLTQRNILSNIEAGLETFPHGDEDRMIAFLPFFHSFGFTATLWLMLHSHCGAVYHANPLEPRVIGGLIQKYKCSFLVGTPTFLNGFVRRCDAEQLGSLSWVLCGAERLSDGLRNAFAEKFGTTPMEGYGTTECAPIVSLNVPDFASPGFYAAGVKHGSIGRPLPGISIRIVHPETGVEVPPDQSGLMLVKGPNVMKGYLNQPEKAARVLHDGWYETGDIAAVDGDGFITITDRLARFSKIAGEMVPHATVEEAMHRLLGLSEQALAVASVPDPRKGERLVVLHTFEDCQIAELVNKLPEAGLPNLWLPRATAFHHIDALPVLGTGKMDIKAVKKLAQQLDTGE